MLTNRTTTRTTSSRRHARRQTSVRRSWLVQKLEPRCVMATDVLGGELSESPWADDSGVEAIDEVPSLISSIRPIAPAVELPQSTFFDEPDVELSLDSFDGIADEIAVDELGHESMQVVELLQVKSIDLELHQNTTVVFTWDANQLYQLLGRSDSLAIHVVYDASRWQVPLAVQTPAEFDFIDLQEAGDPVDQRQLLFESTLSMQALADQSVRIQIDIQPGNVDEGTQPQIFIKLMDPSSDVTGEKWTTEEFVWQAGFTLGTSMEATERWNLPGSKVQQDLAGPASAINTTDEGDAGYSSTENTMIGEESGAQPFSEGDSTPLPESRRESPDRSPRTVRRTLDLRSPGSVSSLAPLASRTAVTPGSLATQASIAGVYESEPSTVDGPSRWLLDPKPARLQVATFVLSRTADGSRTVAVRSEGTRSVDQLGQTPAGIEEKVGTPTVSTESSSQYVISQGSNVESVIESASDGTVTRFCEPIEETHEELEESVRETPVYASIVDRLLGSPVSLVAVLGLTAIARFTETDEASQYLG